jgi:hypothetical protein
VIDCDDPATRAAVRADPARFAESGQAVLIDEYQHVPELLDAIKAQLNRDLRLGRYVLAGSTRYATLPEAAQALTVEKRSRLKGCEMADQDQKQEKYQSGITDTGSSDAVNSRCRGVGRARRSADLRRTALGRLRAFEHSQGEYCGAACAGP